MKTIIFDDNKKYSIDEIDSLINDAYDTLNLMKVKKMRMEIEACDYINKYIYSKEWGYMYVTNQYLIDKSEFNDTPSIYFQGIGLQIEYGKFRDCSYFDYDALKQWTYPISLLQEDIKNGDFVEITKGEFLSQINEKIDGLKSEVNTWTEMLSTKCQNN